jgi:hypothetical protein
MSEPYFIQNLKLTYCFFQNNVLDDLSMKISETYKTFKADEQRGPLFFILMMNHLLSDTQEAAITSVSLCRTRLHLLKSSISTARSAPY